MKDSYTKSLQQLTTLLHHSAFKIALLKPLEELECELPVCLLLLLLLLSCFSRVRLCATPEMEAHQAPPSLGFYCEAILSYTLGYSKAINHIAASSLSMHKLSKLISK